MEKFYLTVWTTKKTKKYNFLHKNKFQIIPFAIFLNFHHRFFLGTRCLRQKNGENLNKNYFLRITSYEFPTFILIIQ